MSFSSYSEQCDFLAFDPKTIDHRNFIFLECDDIFELQNPFCYLWLACTHERKTLKWAYKHFSATSIDTLIARGMNRNFLTRERWLDIDFLSSRELNLSLSDLIRKFSISPKQVEKWKLTREEMIKLGVFGDDKTRKKKQTPCLRTAIIENDLLNSSSGKNGHHDAPIFNARGYSYSQFASCTPHSSSSLSERPTLMRV